MVKRREKELWTCGLGNFQIYIYNYTNFPSYTYTKLYI